MDQVCPKLREAERQRQRETWYSSCIYIYREGERERGREGERERGREGEREREGQGESERETETVIETEKTELWV